MTKRIHSPESNPAAISIPPLRAALNGRVIAPEDATYDAETCPGHLRQALGVRGENKHFDTVLMGRKTYKQGLEIGLSSPYPILEQYLFSTTMEESPDEEVTLVSENAAGLVGGLKSEPGKDIWLAGGATLAASHFSEGLVDELMLKVNPVVLGHPALLWGYKEGRSGKQQDVRGRRRSAPLSGEESKPVYPHRYLPAQQDFLPDYGMPGMAGDPAMCRTFCDAVMRFGKRPAGGKEP